MSRLFRICLVITAMIGVSLLSSLVGSAHAQGVAVNQQGDVIYLSSQATTTTTTTTNKGGTTFASPTPKTVTSTKSTTMINKMVNVPPGYYPDFNTMLTSLLQIALIVSVLMVLFQLVSAGINWITSGGDKAKTENARNKIVAAVIGLVLVVASWAVFLFILQILGLTPAQIIPFYNG